MGCDLYKVSTLGVDVARYMPLETALILVKALMAEYYNDPEIEYSITYRCYHLPGHGKRCPDKDTDKCLTCKYSKAEMSGRDATRLLRGKV